METQQRDLLPKRDEAIDKTWMVVDTGCAVTWPIFRTNAGKECGGKPAAIAFLAMPIWAMQTHSLAVYRYWQLWIGFLIIYRLSRDKTRHTLHPGGSRIFGETRMGIALEAVTILTLGAAFRHHPLGMMIMVSGICLSINELLTRHIIRRQKISIHNAMVEADLQNERFNDAG